MKAQGMRQFSSRGRLIALGVIALALVLVVLSASWVRRHPSSSDASIDADVVHVAAAVGGRIIEIRVHENSPVHRGDVLFQIDPLPYQLLVAQAQADLEVAEAQLQTQRKYVSTQRSNASVARDQAATAKANYELATRTVERLKPLTAKGYVPNQQLDQADVTAHDAATRLQQAEVQQLAAVQAIDTVQAGESLVAARQAALALAKRNLEDTTVRAMHAGLIVGLLVSSGEFVAPGQSLFTLINTEEWFASANLRETDLARVQPGDCATVYSMLDRRLPIRGVIDSIGWGVMDADRINLPRSVPYVERSLNWVRVAQRFPVRIRLESPPPQVMRLGASAVVEVKHGRECR
ncbi:MAG: multidrug transporter subunit MdtN [Gammaproteobacteria bacterium]|nr:multidrug transporter subunit MdtN [Gammaproteobacteria bacterium]